MTTLYRDVQTGEAAPLDELFTLDADAMIINLYEGGLVTRQVRVVRLKGTRRTGTFTDIISLVEEKNVLLEDVDVFTRTDDTGTGLFVDCKWERIGQEVRKVPTDLIKQQAYAAFDAANVIGM